MPNLSPPVVVGAGPAGLTAALELLNHGQPPLVLEAAAQVGGLARTEVYKGYRFDVGGHRFYTRNAAVQRLWRQALGDDFRSVRRLSRIYYNGRFYDYPLKLANTLANLGPAESGRILLSYLAARLRPYQREDTFEQWVCNRFGRRLYETFFRDYTEKVWGIPCAEIRAEWAAQRIQGLSLKSALLNAFSSRPGGSRSLIDRFDYPALGPGMMWQAFQARIQRGGGRVWLQAPVVRLVHDGRRLQRLVIRLAGRDREVEAHSVISSMPVSDLLLRLDPPPPAELLRAARGLNYRAFILVGLIVNRAHLFPDNWLYIHNPGVRVGRVQNFKNWSPDMVPDPSRTSLGLEYFCSQGDELWNRSDEALTALAMDEAVCLGLTSRHEIEDACVIRQPQAYPVYDDAYRRHLAAIQSYLAGFENLQTIGRNGMHRYNNQDHSMLTGLLAARNLLGERHDLWQINTDRSYYEETTGLAGQEGHDGSSRPDLFGRRALPRPARAFVHLPAGPHSSELPT